MAVSTKSALFRKACELIAYDRRGTSRNDGYHALLALQCNAAARAMNMGTCACGCKGCGR
jgi:hypothetical protein